MKIALINMPFADAHRPSLSLTQLRARALALPEVSACAIHYLNQHTARFFGKQLYTAVADHYTSGLGDWLFRHLAFPDAADNSRAYFDRHFPYTDPHSLALKQRLFECRDGLGAFLEQLIEDFALDQYDLVGFTSMFSQTVPSIAMARLLKRRNPKLVAVIGGANCESPMGQELARHVPALDYVFSGPALVSFPRLLEHLTRGERDAAARLAGVFSQSQLDNLDSSRRFGPELPLDAIVPLDFQAFLTSFDDLFPDDREQVQLVFETSRGCWWGERSHCSFCGLNSQTMSYRAMSAPTAQAKLVEVLAYADRCTHFASVDNIMPRTFIDEVLAHVDVPAHVDLFYEVKADLDDAQLAALAHKRVVRLQPGIEALSTSTLKLMKKGTTAFGNLRFLQGCLRHGIQPEWNLLVGFPGEGEEVYLAYRQLLPLLHHLPPPGGCYPVRFDRYSPYHARPQEYGLRLRAYDFYGDVFPFPAAAIENLAYYFQDTELRADYSRTMLRHIATLRRLVEAWQQHWQERRPALAWQADQSLLDTRGPTPRRHQLTPAERQLLGLLREFRGPDSLARLSELAPEQVSSALATLREKGLLFEEGGRYGSLLPTPPPPLNQA